MKNHLLTVCSILLFSLLLSSSCRKEAVDVSAFEKATDASNLASSDGLHLKSSRLVNLDWGDGTSWHFHYNEKGLADKWIMDFGDGLPHNFTLKYDNQNRLIKAFDHYNNTIYTYLFTYSGDRLIKQTWSNNTTSDGGEIVNTYNSRGQIVRRDDNINDKHAVIVHNIIGNSTHFDFYLGKELLLTGDFTFRMPNRNPLLTVNGLDVGFFYYNYGLWDKWWETSDHYILYDNGKPVDLIDHDPSKTTMHFGQNYYISSVDYYDRVSKSTITNTLSYENRSNKNEVSNAETLSGKAAMTNNNSRLIRQLLFIPGSAKSIKEQIKELRKQHE